jgi:hypothetical protein
MVVSMGLLGNGFEDPRSSAIMALAGGLLKGDFGGGLLGANQAYAQTQAGALQKQIQEMQMRQQQMALEKSQRDDAMEQQLADAARNSFRTPEMARAMSMGPTIDGGPVPDVMPGFDKDAFLQRAYTINPMKAVSLEQAWAKNTSPIAVAPGASLVDRKTMKPVFTAPDKADKPPSSVQEYQFAQGQGYKGTFEQFQKDQKQAGANNVQVRVDNKMGESLAGQIGPMVKDSRTQTDGAVKMFDAADRIERALNSNQVLAGPGSTQLQTVRQVIQKIGGGSDEGIRQTRQVIKSLAQMSVEARKQLAGQGQVTETEAAAVAKADAGDINDLTVGELKDLVTLTKRASHYTAQGHANMLKELQSNPATAGLVPFYQVPRMDTLLNHKPTLPQIGKQPALEDILNKYR